MGISQAIGLLKVVNASVFCRILSAGLAGCLVLVPCFAFGAPDIVEIPQRKPSVPPLETPEPDVWSTAEIDAAHKECFERLNQVVIDYILLEPVKKGVCGSPAPLSVTALGAGENRVVIDPPAILNCKMAATLARWFNAHVQPAALRHLNSNVVGIRNVASYACRRRYGNPNKRMSEHAYANALDIAWFQIGSVQTVSLVNDWGVTKRELLEREKQEQARLSGKQVSNLQSRAVVPAEKVLEAGEDNKDNDRKARSAAGGSDPGSDPDQTSVPWAANVQQGLMTAAEVAQEKDPKRLFLREIYDGACKLFGTVLSPEANHAHRDHFHLDLAPRRRSAFCQ